jgi:hypothetical protein
LEAKEMIEHPYIEAGEFHAEAHNAAMHRALYYGTGGLLDPRTYTLEPYIFRRAGLSWSAAYRASAMTALWTVPIAATLGYLGYDPLNLTPGYGITSDRETSRDRLGRPFNREILDVLRFMA